MTTKELKEKYIKFFQSKGHAVIPSASLIPENDPTVLFTTAGMQPLVPYLLGEKHPSGSRLVDVQKCMRTGDIEEVGDNVHLTFFEMLGNWSLGDYWKKESITWSFEFLTKELRIPIGKLAVSCFAGDENASKDVETAEVWKSLGIPEGRIYFLSRKDNWWGPVGNIGPCGPDTEVFYWTGEDKPSDLTTSDNKEGWVEIWNNVFMQYEKTSSGKYAPLKQKNVDTGMGVERTTAILNGKDNVFNVNELNLITDEVKKVSTKEDERSLRIVVDHLRASTFILGDQRCIAPSNVDQGYVLRRLIRRAIRHGKMLGITKPFLVGLSRIVVDEYSSDYPELKENQNFIEKYLSLEEEKFTKTLNEGQKESFKKIKMLLDLNEKVKVSGSDVLKAAKISFDLYQSSGYPLEMFLEDLKDKKGLDKETSDKICKDVGRLISSHQSISRAGSEKRFKGGLSDQSDTNIKYHTATHLLNMALRKVLGDHVRQIGSNITKERLRFDFPNPVKLTEDQVKEVEKIVNDIVDRKIPVGCIILPKEEAIKKGVTYLQGEQYPDQVKVYFVGNDLDSAESKELCGGPHVSNTRDLDHIEVFKQDKIGEGKMRVYARFK